MPLTPQESTSRATRSRRTHELLQAAHLLDAADIRRAALLDEVVLINRVVAEAIAARYRGRGIDEADLRQSAFEGLIKAVRSFDPTVRPDLLTYAVPTIRGQVLRHFRDLGWMVRPPRSVQELQAKVSRSIEKLAGLLGRSPTDTEISTDLDCSVEQVREANAAYGAFRPVSLDAPRGEQEMSVIDALTDPDDRSIDAAEARAMIRPAMSALTQRERTVLDLLYVDGRSQSEVGELLGITQMSVSRLLAKIHDRLRKQLGVTERRSVRA